MVLNLSGDMQISTPHTRFFRLFYCSPKQGDIYSGINIRIHIVPAMIALERLVIPSANMMALGTSLGSICWWNDNQRYSIPFSLVFNKRPKLEKTPRVKFSFERFIPTLGIRSDVCQVFNGDANSSSFSFIDYSLGDGVIDYRCRGSLFPFKPFQESSASTFTFTCSTSSAFGLNRTTNFHSFFPVLVKKLRRVFFTVRRAGYISYSKITTDKLFDIFHVFLGNFYRLKKVKLASLENKIGFSLDIWKVISVMTNESNLLPLVNSPYRSNVFMIRKYTAIIAYTSKFIENTSFLPVKLVRVSDLANTTNNYLSGKFKLVSNVIITQVMKFKLIKNSILPCDFRNKITSCVSLLDRFKKSLILVASWNKFYFQYQFHVTNIQNIPDIFKYLKNNIINIKKGKWFNSSHNLNICGYL